MNRFVRLTAAILAVVFLACWMPLPTHASQSTDDYVEGVLKRLEESYTKGPYVIKLSAKDEFSYCQWAQEIENKGAGEKLVLWATDRLLGKQLNKNAYISYLTTLLSLMEKGFAESAAAQAAYTEKMSVGDYAETVVNIALESLFSAGKLDSLEDTVKLMGGTFDVMKLSNQSITDYQQLAVYAASSVVHDQKILFLQAIADNTDDSALREAAQYMIHLCNYELLYVVSNYSSDFMGISVDVAAAMAGEDALVLVVSQISDVVSKKFAASLAEHKVAQAIVSNAGLYAQCLGCVITGFQIGGLVMSLFYGDQAELFREMKAMDAISDALIEAFRAAEKDTQSGDSASRYEATRRFVAIGQGLVYTHMRGEYCCAESRRPNLSEDELKRLDSYMAAVESNLQRYCSILESIFPEPQAQVIVMTEITSISATKYYSSIARPVVYLPGNDTVASAINSNAALCAFMDDRLASAERGADEDSTSGGGVRSYYLNLYGVSARKDCLSLALYLHDYGGGRAWSETFSYYNFSLETGENMSITQMFDPSNENAAQMLCDVVLQSPNMYPTGMDCTPEALYWTCLEDTSCQYLQWYFGDDEVSILLNASLDPNPNRARWRTVTLSYDQVAGIFDPAYLPQSRTYPDEGSVVLELAETFSPDPGTQSYGFGSRAAAVVLGPVYELRVTCYPEEYNHGYESPVMIVAYTNYTDGDVFWLPDAVYSDYWESFTFAFNSAPEHLYSFRETGYELSIG